MSTPLARAVIESFREENQTLKETIKGYQSVINIANESNATQQECIRNLNETIKGLDRRTREYQEECARLQERIDTLLEAQASVPTRDVNGTIEAQQSLIRKLKGDVLALQRKVDEQDERLAKSCVNVQAHEQMR